MAEIIGIVASGVGLAAFAGQTLDGALKVQRLWNAVKNAPQDVADLVDEVVSTASLLSDIEARVIQMPSIARLQTPLEKCFAQCKKIAESLESIALSLETSLRRKQAMGQIRVALKRETIASHKLRLESAKTTLLLAIQSCSAYVPVLQYCISR